MPALSQKFLKAIKINNILLAIYPLYLVVVGGSILVFYNFWLHHIGEAKISKDILIRGQQEYVYPEAAEQFTFILAAIYIPLLALLVGLFGAKYMKKKILISQTSGRR